MPDGMSLEKLQDGGGPHPTPHSHVAVHYTGRLLSGQKFDSSRDRDEPFTFVLGAHQVRQHTPLRTQAGVCACETERQREMYSPRVVC